MFMIVYFSLTILILVLGMSLSRIKSHGLLFNKFLILSRGIVNKNDKGGSEAKALLPPKYKYFFIFSIVLIFIFLFYQSYQQYQAWSQNEISRYLLPPYQGIGYFIFYVGARLLAPYLISLTAALGFLFSAKALNKKYDERFFYPEELWFGALALFLTGWPSVLFYFVGLVLIYLIIHTSYFIINNSSQRFSLYYLWIPMGIFVILISKWIQTLSFWQLLKL